MTARAASYFSRLAPAAASATALPRLQPPRLMFRPSVAPMPFVELPAQQPPVAPLARPTAREIATDQTDATMIAPPAAQPTTGAPGPARIATASPRTAERPRVASPRPTTAAAVRQSAQPGVATGEDSPMARPVDHAVPVATATPGRRQDHERSNGDAAGSLSAAPHANAAPPQRAAVPISTPAEPRARPGSPTALVPPQAVPRPAIRPAAADASTGLRIGTLEVRVAAPPAAAPTPSIAAPAAQKRRGQIGGPPARIARPFALFGLGQS